MNETVLDLLRRYQDENAWNDTVLVLILSDFFQENLERATGTGLTLSDLRSYLDMRAAEQDDAE